MNTRLLGFIRAAFLAALAVQTASADLPEIQVMQRDDLRSVTSVTISPDGAYLYAAAFNPGNVLTFKRDVASGKIEYLDLMTGAGLNAAVIATQKFLQKHYERPAAPDGGVNPGDVEVADLGPVVEPVNPALRIRLDAATRGASELGALSLELAPGVGVAIPKWSREPLQVVDQLEAFLALLDALTQVPAPRKQVVA
jgi:hypothetical protein